MKTEIATVEMPALHLAVGPDGANLLGYLAALGSLVLLARAWPDRAVRLGWTLPRQGPAAGRWRPVFLVEPSVQRDDLVAALAEAVQASAADAAFDGLDDNLKSTTVSTFREVAVRARDGARQDRRAADLLAALAASGTTDGDTKVTASPLRALTGAVHQDFLKTLRELSGKVEAQHIRRALFEPWSYPDNRLTFRWDPADYRPYALRARDPSNDPIHPIRTEWGANRLAFEGLALFPMIWAPKPGTVGFHGGEIRWALWPTPVSVPVLRSLLAHPDLFAESPGRLGRLGVSAVVRARRFSSGKGYFNFGPGRAVWIDSRNVFEPVLPSD